MILKRILKPVLTFVLIVCLASQMGFAQSRRHDLSLGYGVGTLDQVSDIIENIMLITITLGTFAKTEMKYSGAPFLTYHYSRNSRFGIGLAVGGYQSTGVLQNNITEEPAGDFKETNYVGALEIDYHWIMKKGFQLYSGLGAGLRLRKGTYTSGADTDTSSKALPTFHINALGFRIGGKVGLFGEIGAGYKGFLCFGLNAQF